MTLPELVKHKIFLTGCFLTFLKEHVSPLTLYPWNAVSPLREPPENSDFSQFYCPLVTLTWVAFIHQKLCWKDCIAWPPFFNQNLTNYLVQKWKFFNLLWQFLKERSSPLTWRKEEGKMVVSTLTWLGFWSIKKKSKAISAELTKKMFFFSLLLFSHLGLCKLMSLRCSVK